MKWFEIHFMDGSYTRITAASLVMALWEMRSQSEIKSIERIANGGGDKL